MTKVPSCPADRSKPLGGHRAGDAERAAVEHRQQVDAGPDRPDQPGCPAGLLGQLDMLIMRAPG